ncbi:hypothetical protein BC830DRAFT_1175335 [Chytriomyces sp. MP71]|nr:hypothetical protein BC830DRAFT_1175335 [Chytriomyces sp. MP71]
MRNTLIRRRLWYPVFEVHGIQSREELLDELARLTEVHAITEQQYLTAHLALQFSNAKYSAIKQFQSSAAINTRVLDATTQKLEKAVRPTQETIKEVIETQLPGLWVDLAEHSVKSAILATDHEAKVLRHERLLSDLQQFIDLLLAQQSRHQLLAIAFETEHSMIK